MWRLVNRGDRRGGWVIDETLPLTGLFLAASNSTTTSFDGIVEMHKISIPGYLGTCTAPDQTMNAV